MKHLIFILSIFLSFSIKGQNLDSIFNYETLIGRTHILKEEFGNPKGFISGFIDEKNDYILTGLNYKKGVIFTLELKVGMNGDWPVFLIKDIIAAPNKCYYVSTNCFKKINNNDTVGYEYVVFKQKSFFAKDKILSIYKVNRDIGKFEKMPVDCFQNCLIYNEMSKFKIKKSKKSWHVSYFQ